MPTFLLYITKCRLIQIKKWHFRLFQTDFCCVESKKVTPRPNPIVGNTLWGLRGTDNLFTLGTMLPQIGRFKQCHCPKAKQYHYKRPRGLEREKRANHNRRESGHNQTGAFFPLGWIEQDPQDPLELNRVSAQTDWRPFICPLSARLHDAGLQERSAPTMKPELSDCSATGLLRRSPNADPHKHTEPQTGN